MAGYDNPNHKLIIKEIPVAQMSNTVGCYVSESVQKEINRIKRIATIYTELKSLMPGYESEYMDALVLEMANRFDNG